MEFSNFTVAINGIHTRIQYNTLKMLDQFLININFTTVQCFKLSLTQDSHMLMLVIRAIIVIVGFSKPLSLADVFYTRHDFSRNWKNF